MTEKCGCKERMEEHVYKNSMFFKNASLICKHCKKVYSLEMNVEEKENGIKSTDGA